MKKIAFILATALLAQPVLAKGVEAHNAYARAVVAGVQQSGAFVTLKNTDAKDNVLVGASVSKRFAERTELHTHINENGVMRMREVKGGIPLPAGKVVELKPGSYHIMFFGLKQEMKAGKKIPITLKFKNGKAKKITATVKEIQKTAAPHNHDHKHGEHHNHDHHDHAHGEHHHH